MAGKSVEGVSHTSEHKEAPKEGSSQPVARCDGGLHVWLAVLVYVTEGCSRLCFVELPGPLLGPEHEEDDGGEDGGEDKCEDKRDPQWNFEGHDRLLANPRGGCALVGANITAASSTVQLRLRCGEAVA